MVFHHSVKARNFQGRKKRAEKFNKNAQKRQISMKELRYAQKLLKGKRFWPYFQHLDKNFLSLIWETQKMQIQKKWHKDFTFFHEKNDEMKMQFYNSNLRVINLSECFQKFSCAHCVIFQFFRGEKSWSKKNWVEITMFENYSKCRILILFNFGIFHQFLSYYNWPVW